jgi:transglutaminase-like putative cysteine protease
MLKNKFAWLLLSLMGLSALARADAPDWLRQLAKQPTKSYADDVDIVYLLEEKTTTIRENGEIVKHGRVAWRILRPEGKKRNYYYIDYDNDSAVLFLHGWSITAKGQEYDVKDVFERTATSYEVYSDSKVKIGLAPGAEVGTVIGFEYERKARPYIFQDYWDFQGDFPVEQSRYELHLGQGWRYRSEWVNHDVVQPTEDHGTLVWQAGDVSRIEREPNRPDGRALAGLMVVTFLSDRMPAKTYKDWKEFGTWYTDLASGMRNPSSAVQQKVEELAPATWPLMQRVRALAEFAQRDVRYVAIEIGVGGFRPHSASDIFTHRYGDCKDKATMLSSMLAQIGVKSYYIVVNATRGVVKKNTPTFAYAFNHMILAVALPNASYSMPLQAVYEHPKYGHLLIFDPTNETVPFGQIPYYEQDSYGLLVGDEGGELIHFPVSNPEANSVVRTAKLQLDPDGTLHGQIEEVRSGFEAERGRAFLQHETEQDRRKVIENALGRSLGNFVIENYELVNANDIDKNLIIRYTFRAERYAKNAGALLLVRPRVVGDMAGGWDTSKPRHYAYEFPAPFLRSDTVELVLPEGFKVSEVPDATQIKLPFAEYSSRTEASGNVLKYTRQYRMLTTEVPFEQTANLKKLFDEINGDEKGMAVLRKQ